MERGLSIAPGAHAVRDGNGFVALTADPWLTIDDSAVATMAGRVVEIVYRSGFWDEPARPLFRFETAGGLVVERIAAAAVAGAGIWIGRVPKGTIRAAVSPTNRPGPFTFAIESIRARAWLRVLALGFMRVPRSARSAVLTRLIGWAPESDINLAWATGSVPLGAYAAWRDKRHRALDLDGIDTPRFDWATAPIHVVVQAALTPEDLDATLDSLRAQVFEHWTALVLGTRPSRAPDDLRITQAGVADAETILAGTDGLVTVLRAGDRLPPRALACAAEAAFRHPERGLFYGDEEIVTAPRIFAGHHRAIRFTSLFFQRYLSRSPGPLIQALLRGPLVPVFKPGWSAALNKQRPILGRAVYLRAPGAWTGDERTAFLANGLPPARLIDGRGQPDPMPIRRVLLQTRAAPPAIGPVSSRLAPPPYPAATVAIVIPTRDQAGFLRLALASIRRFPATGQTRIVIVDNGSIEDETRRLFAEAAGDPAITIRPHPGPFNFSLMCNVAAASTDADVLLFLNNDTEALTPDWLDRLKAWALDPAIGAVGARLTYPDGRLQHSGVLLGMGDSAGHFGAFAAPDDPGWAGRNTAVHDVAAVTGACLAVSRVKFEAVSGFDAVDLPVELSDIDLCLKLAERGWRTIVDPAVHLNHAESASRGTATFRRLDVYESQRAVFKARWRHILRDDPYFHPGLSLYRWHAALG